MSKRTIIKLNETQFKNVISRIISEQQQGGNKSVFTVDLSNAFPSGQYELSKEFEKDVNDAIVKIRDFVTNKNIDNFTLTISSSESQVPNPSGIEKKELARRRANSLKDYLDKALPAVLNNVKAEVVVLEPQIGSTQWDPKLGKDNPKYKAEQNVKLNVVLNATIPDEPKKNYELLDTVKMNNPQGNPSGIGFVFKVKETKLDPQTAYYKVLNTYNELEIFPSDTGYYRTVVANNQQGLEDAIEKYKKMYKTDVVHRGTTKQNNYSPEGIEQMKRQNVFS